MLSLLTSQEIMAIGLIIMTCIVASLWVLRILSGSSPIVSFTVSAMNHAIEHTFEEAISDLITDDIPDTDTLVQGKFLFVNYRGPAVVIQQKAAKEIGVTPVATIIYLHDEEEKKFRISGENECMNADELRKKIEYLLGGDKLYRGSIVCPTFN